MCRREGPAVEQFAREHEDEIQVVGVGAQDDFAYALDFIADTGVETPTMIWDPSFATWQTFGVRLNSQMMVMSPDLTRGTDLFYGFGFDEQQQILAALPTFN